MVYIWYFENISKTMTLVYILLTVLLLSKEASVPQENLALSNKPYNSLYFRAQNGVLETALKKVP